MNSSGYAKIHTQPIFVLSLEVWQSSPLKERSKQGSLLGCRYVKKHVRMYYIIYIYTWNLFVLHFGASTLQKKGHSGSKKNNIYIYYMFFSNANVENCYFEIYLYNFINNVFYICIYIYKYVYLNIYIYYSYFESIYISYIMHIHIYTYV